MVMMLLVAFVQISATAAHGTANESPCAASDEAANQHATARSTNDGGVTFPPMLILIPGYGFVGKRPWRLGGGHQQDVHREGSFARERILRRDNRRGFDLPAPPGVITQHRDTC